MCDILKVSVGIFFSTSAAALFTVNAALLMVLVRHKEFSSSSYRIIKHMCVACLLQSFVFFVSGFMTMFDSNFNFYGLGAIVQSAWMLYVGLNFTVAVDRLGIFISSSNSTTRDHISWFLLCVSWILGLGYFLCLVFPGFGFTYRTQYGYFFWFYTTQPGSTILAAIEPFIDFSCFSVELVIYCIVFFTLVKMRRSSIASVQSPSLKIEIRLFCVAIVSFIYETIFIFWFFWALALLSDTLAVEISVNVIWLFESGLFSCAMIVVNNSTYRIIKHMCVACLLQSFVFFVSGFMTMFDSNFNFYVERVLGAIVQSAWMLYVGLNFTVAVDRLGIFVSSCNSATRDRISWFLLCVSWLLGLSYFACLFCPGFGFSYRTPYGFFLWTYSDESGSTLLATIEPYIDFVSFAVELVIYCIVFFTLMRRSSMASSQSLSLKIEIRLFCVAIVSFIYETIFILWFFWAFTLLPDTLAVEISINTMWLFESGLFSCAMIAVNQSIRSKLCRMIPFRRKFISVVSVAPRSIRT
uniref:Serpentine receptor class gamma n=1 Tax=Steinernema glaseri TaxID=37863 RepID=A0A1I8AVB7_9BILA